MNTKKNKKEIDPPRFPNIILPYEHKAKKAFKEMGNSLIRELTNKMIDYQKQK